MQNKYDWRKCRKGGFPYKSNDDPKYLKDRAELFASNGNGWWWWQGTSLGKNIGTENEEING